MTLRRIFSALLALTPAISLATSAVVAHADGAGDNSTQNVRHIPPTGVTVGDADRTDLQTGLDSLQKAIAELKALSAGVVANQPPLLPDVEIYDKAVAYALKYNEFFSQNDVRAAKALLQQGLERAASLKTGKAPWTTQTGPIVRGYRSRIDGSVQPYGLIVPAGYDFDHRTAARIDIWFHGRGETLSEVNFINDSQHSMGEFAPAGAFVLRPYGRYCNPSRFAGETDTFEALDAIRKAYGIDEHRIAVRGFSLGGAACWDFTTHFAGDWAAANPGAGFSETADFLKVFQNETLAPSWYEQKLWHLYDATDYAINVFNTTTIVYSGELDSQRQAAEMMVKACTAEGLQLTHIIGPGAHHFYEKNAKAEVAKLVDAAVEKGRNDAPDSVRFTTWTLKYNRMKWVTLDSMSHHWDRARINADAGANGSITITTENAEAFTLNLPSNLVGTSQGKPSAVIVDGQPVEVRGTRVQVTYRIHLRKNGTHWTSAGVTGREAQWILAKKHNLQGPIDDAFMEGFIMVKPTGTPLNNRVGAWAQQEMDHAVTQWRQQFRGDAIVKSDTEVTRKDIAESNLVLWGDPRSNKLLARIAAKLPLKWTANGIQLGNRTYPETSAAILIFPNPLNPQHYVVLNSGFTYREYDYLNNARQTPKLPDWAVIDVTTPPDSRYPGKIVNAGFFGEHWEYTDSH